MTNQELDFSCPGGCGGMCGCPSCSEAQGRKKNMMSLGYSEAAIDAVLFGEKKGLWANIHAKRKRIKEGSGERMRSPGEKGAPSAKDLKDAGKNKK